MEDVYISRVVNIDVADGSPQYFTFNNLDKYKTIDVHFCMDKLGTSEEYPVH